MVYGYKGVCDGMSQVYMVIREYVMGCLRYMITREYVMGCRRGTVNCIRVSAIGTDIRYIHEKNYIFTSYFFLISVIN